MIKLACGCSHILHHRRGKQGQGATDTNKHGYRGHARRVQLAALAAVSANSSIMQDGTLNGATVSQSGLMNMSSVMQTGTSHTALVTQLVTSENQSNVTQTGTGHMTTVIQ